MFGLCLTQAPRQLLALQCSVCKQYIDSEVVKDTTIQVAIFGVTKYAVCSCCGMECNDRSKGYKQRWTRWRNKHLTP